MNKKLTIFFAFLVILFILTVWYCYAMFFSGQNNDVPHITPPHQLGTLLKPTPRVSLTNSPPATNQPSSSFGISSTFFGMDMMDQSSNFPWPNEPVGSMGKVPGTSWYYLESCSGGPDPSNACYHWEGLDKAVKDAEIHNISIIYTIGHIPVWAEPSSWVEPGSVQSNSESSYKHTNLAPAKWQYLKDFVTALATRYKGKIQYYEEQNEPSNFNSWGDTFDNLVTFSKTAYEGIKAVDPNALVGSPGFGDGYVGQPKNSPTYIAGTDNMIDWARKYFLAGGNKYADFAGYHPYAINSYVPNSISLGCQIKKSLTIDCAGQPIYTTYDQFRSMMDDVGLKGKPIINTEGGWGESYNISYALEPAYIARWYILFASAGANGTTGVATAYWYGWNIKPFDINGQYGSNPAAGVAYGQVYNWLVGAKFTSRCFNSGSLWTCPIVRSSAGYQGLIVWNEDSTTTYTPGSQFTQYRDLSGNTHTVSGSITVDDNPILFETQ